jgi:hypothetical protein
MRSHLLSGTPEHILLWKLYSVSIITIFICKFAFEIYAVNWLLNLVWYKKTGQSPRPKKTSAQKRSEISALWRFLRLVLAAELVKGLK